MKTELLRLAEEIEEAYKGLHPSLMEGHWPAQLRALAAQPAAQVVPDGRVMVPREPTQAMQDAGEKALGQIDTRWNDAPMWDVWAAMLAAAPSQGEGT